MSPGAAVEARSVTKSGRRGKEFICFHILSGPPFYIRPRLRSTDMRLAAAKPPPTASPSAQTRALCKRGAQKSVNLPNGCLCGYGEGPSYSGFEELGGRGKAMFSQNSRAPADGRWDAAEAALQGGPAVRAKLAQKGYLIDAHLIVQGSPGSNRTILSQQNRHRF